MNFTADYFGHAKDIIRGVFKEVRPELMAAYGKVEHSFKDDKSVVTQLDKDIETKISAALTAFDPSIGIVGEEFGQSGNKDTFWLVDPIDGTELFVRGIPHARNMVTLISAGRPQMAIVYKFVTDEFYEAIEGQGSFCNGIQQHVSDRELDRAWIQFTDKLDVPAVQQKLITLRQHIHGVMITRDFSSVVNGQLDALVSYKSGGGTWDYAPRALLIQEAGGQVSNFGSDTYDYRVLDMIAANPLIYDELKKILEAA